MTPRKSDIVYRARGVYKGTGRETWVTTCWRRSRAEAQSDLKTYGHRFTHPKIKTLDYMKYANQHSHQKNPYPRIE